MGFTKDGLIKVLEELKSKLRYDDYLCTSVFGDSDEDFPIDAGNCTRNAKYVLQKLGLNKEIWGYDWHKNKSAELGEAEGGHDFAVVDGRFLVDLWAMDYYDTEGVYDLTDARDQREVKRLYGDRQKWVRLSDKDFKNIVLSYTLDQLVKKTEKPETHERAYRCKTLRIKYEPKTNRYVFLSRGSEPWSDSKGHLVSVLFDYDVDTTKKHEFNKRPYQVGMRVFCSCPAFLYWGSKYISTDEDYHLPEHDEDRPPDIRDPGRINWLCKHVVSLRYKTLYTIRMKQLQDRYAKIPKHHLEKTEEMREDKYLKEKVLKDKKGKQSSVLVGGEVMSFDEFALIHTMNDMDMVEVDAVNPIANEFSQRMNLGIDVDLTEDGFEDQLDEIGMLVKG